jgi:formylglycine-generating enzyme required for sulfatase activity
VRLQRLPEGRPTMLQRELRNGEYHILHFIGHAGFDRETQGGVLILRDEAGRGRRVTGEHLGTILHDHRSLRLVVLNACEGARTLRADPFAGIAQTLVQQGVPAVIAMQFEITDQAAIIFAEEFYAALADGHPVDAALAGSRKAIFAAGNDIEWGTPVLYLRAPDGCLFSVDREAPPHRPPPDALPARQKRRLEWTQWKKIAATIAAMLIAMVLASTIVTYKPEKRADVARHPPAGSATPPAARQPNAFRECEKCPELAIVAPGRFSMGETPAEEIPNAGPQHEVTLARFALSRTPVTFDEWQVCFDDGRCDKYSPPDQGRGRGRRPVINVSWHDAQAYVSWLSGKTGRPYRLPSEAEWEHAARDWTQMEYAGGRDRDPRLNNGADSGGQTTEVRSYLENLIGVSDIIGSIREWVEDCWHENYTGAPKDGTAWVDADGCKSRVVRGGSLDFDF